MKLGLVIYGSLDTVSGGYLYDRKLVEYLRAQGDTVEIISLPWRNYAAHLTDNLPFRLPKDLEILIQDELNHPSLISANAGKHLYPIISLVHHLRSSELRARWQNWFYRIVEKKYLQNVDGFIFNSQTTKGVVNNLIGDNKPSIVAYPPTDRFGEAISETVIFERVKSDELRILFVGNLIYRKGLHILLEAVTDLKPKVRVDVVGGLNAEPKYTEELQRQIDVNHLSSFVFLHGPLDQAPLTEKFRNAHVLVVPSSYEGFGIVYLEGMGFGLPAIGTSAGAAREIIEDGKTGYLIQPNDSKSLADRLREFARNRELLTKLSLNALKRYKSQPRWEETAKSIREFLRFLH
ncbi:MAG: glycosyltransferase family 1 protein [Anaerolineae bacterium]|nr:MAG: glycosyltransferase family 1 protein [Anaerolineae bacterium]WKZ45678.1 MAG: glycosyltransferase family 4 protein [Anaerolineales bacterium]